MELETVAVVLPLALDFFSSSISNVIRFICGTNRSSFVTSCCCVVVVVVCSFAVLVDNEDGEGGVAFGLFFRRCSHASRRVFRSNRRRKGESPVPDTVVSESDMTSIHLTSDDDNFFFDKARTVQAPFKHTLFFLGASTGSR